MELKLQKQLFKDIEIDGHRFRVDVKDTSKIEALENWATEQNALSKFGKESLEDCPALIDKILGDGAFETLFKGYEGSSAQFELCFTLHSIFQDEFLKDQQAKVAEEEKKNLDKKVTLAAQLDATNIRIEPRNKRGKVAKKVKDVVKLAISFTVVKNITAENGERTIYVRITKPDNDVLTKSASNTFPYENRTLVYSIKKYIEYNGEEQNINVFWDVEEFLYAGNYRVDIFEGGNLIGSQTFMLD